MRYEWAFIAHCFGKQSILLVFYQQVIEIFLFFDKLLHVLFEIYEVYSPLDVLQLIYIVCPSVDILYQVS